MRKLLFFLFKLFILACIIILGYIIFKEKTITPAKDFDSIIVLGAQVKEDGSLSNQLLLRLTRTLEAYMQNQCLIVTTGSRGENEPLEEGIAMRDWLVKSGVNPNDVVAETNSKSTIENIKFANKILVSRGKSKPAIVTSDYHLPRALQIAKDLSINAQGIPSPTKSEYWLKNHSREVLSWGKYLLNKYVLSQK